MNDRVSAKEAETKEDNDRASYVGITKIQKKKRELIGSSKVNGFEISRQGLRKRWQ